MSLLAVKKLASESAVPLASYDSTKWNYPTLCRKRADLSPAVIGPIIPAVARPFEGSSAKSGTYPHVIPWSSRYDWVFLADNTAAAATRVLILQIFDKDLSTWSFNGVVTLTFPSATAHTIRGLRMSYDKYTTGTAAVSGTAVTGTSTAWLTSRIPIGCRIGFGSSDPTLISTWYEISAVGSDTGITLTASAGTIGDGPYVIEDLRALISTTNATTTNGGLYVVKGLRPELFIGTAAGTTIPAAASTDMIRAVYWLADAATVTNITAAGITAVAKTDWINQDVYIPDLVSAGNYKIFKYNARKALTLTTGKDTTCLILATGNNAFTGTGVQLNNGRIGTLAHGPASGVAALYMVSTTRILCAPLSGITGSATGIFAYTMVEVPPGGINTFAATAVMNAIEIADIIDRLVIFSTGATGLRSYVTQFRNDSGQMDHIFLIDDKQLDASTADTDATPHGTTQSLNIFGWSEGGLLYMIRGTSLTNTNVMIVVPLGADWTYAESKNQRLIAPKMATPNALKYDRAWICRGRIVGSDKLGMTPDSFNVWYRTSGIDDNTGTFVQLADGNDLSGVDGAAYIQFAFSFRIISTALLPARIFSIAVTYEDNSTDSHWQLSVGQSNLTTKKFGFRFATGYGGTVPRLEITLYDAVSGSVLATDDSVTQAGTWQKSTNGGSSYGSYDSTDKTNETTYIQFTPASLADSVNVVPVLSLY